MCLCGCNEEKETEPVFISNIETESVPWTHLNFKDDPAAFQFAIVTDRTGGNRPGIFPKAMERLNWLQPEFVINVGDLIRGYTTRPEEINKQWDEVESLISTLQMPFFYVPGNHDVSNHAMNDIWKQKFGRTYYHFIYRDVLFLCLDTQDGPREKIDRNINNGSRFGSEQIEYARETISRSPNVRWTMIFMHQPLWVYDEKNPKQPTGFSEVIEALKERSYTVIAGHNHRYTSFERNHRNYYILATTGGGQYDEQDQLRGQSFGEFDHVVWTTMTDEGPVLANLRIDGILPDDIRTEADARNQDALMDSLEHIRLQRDGQGRPFGQIQVDCRNIYPDSLTVKAEWQHPEKNICTVEPKYQEITVPAGQTGMMTWKINFHEMPKSLESVKFLPQVSFSAATTTRNVMEDYRLNEIDTYFLMNTQVLQPRRLTKAPEIDGKLDDAAWNSQPDIDHLVPISAEGSASVPTAAWVGYDDKAIYIAARCDEPNPEQIVLLAEDSSDAVWDDDSVEIFFDGNFDRKTFYQIMINTTGVMREDSTEDTNWSPKYSLAVDRAAGYWTVEIAIDWKSIGLAGAPASDQRIGFNLMRNRPRETAEHLQWCPTNMQARRPHLFGQLAF